MREAESDAREREREQRDLSELRARVFGSAPPDDERAHAHWERARRDHDAQYQPKLIVDARLQVLYSILPFHTCYKCRYLICVFTLLFIIILFFFVFKFKQT